MASRQRHLFQRFVDFGTGNLPAKTKLHGGRYSILQTVGQGGMGAVYLALDAQQSDKLVAIKEMSQGRLKDANELQKAQQLFQQEADILRKLSHPHLPKVYDSFQDRDRSYLVMDYIKGKTLAQLLKQARGAALPVATVLDYGLQLCDVLHYLHTYYPPVIFRDLKPSNILVQDNGQLFLIDFGIARFWQHNPDPEVLITPGYASPEQYGGKSIPRSDIFGLGATLHHCLTGYNPQSKTQAHQWDFLPVDFFNSQAPAELCALVAQMVKMEAKDRPVNVAEVQGRLNNIRAKFVGSFRLASDNTYDPSAPTYQMGSLTKTTRPSLREWLRLPLAGLGVVGNNIVGAFALAFQGVTLAKIGSSLRAFPAQWWKRLGQAIDNWSWDQRVWTPRFIGVLLAALALILGGSLYLLKTAPDASHLTALALIFGLICLLVVNLRDERLTDPVLRSIFGLMGGGLLLAGFTLQALPDMVALEQQYLPLITLSQVCALVLLVGAVICLLRPAKRLAWVDHLQLGFLAGSCALLHYGFGSTEATQLPFLTPTSVQQLLPIVVWGFTGLAIVAVFCYARPFKGWSNFTLLLVALASVPLQYVLGYHELQSLFAGSDPSNTLLQQLAQANVFCVFVPLVCALLAFFTRQPESSQSEERRLSLFTRLTFFLVTLVVAGLLSQFGQHIEIPSFPINTFPLSITVLTFSTLYQLIEPLLVLLIFIALLRLRQGKVFTLLDHTVMVGLAIICALFDSAYWQAQVATQVGVIDQQAANQQFLVLAAQLPALMVYGLLIGLLLGLILLAFCHFRQQSHPSARLDAWLKRLRALLVQAERLLVLALIAIALILQGFFGSFKTVIAAWLKSQQFIANTTSILAMLTIGVLVLLGLFALVVCARLLVPSRPGIGGTERWATWLAALACLFLSWQDPHLGTLPLLQTSIQLTGNWWHWPTVLLALVFLGGLLFTAALARFWLKRGFFTRYRALMQPAFVLAMFCFLIQLFWPVFLPLGLIIVIVGVLLASQVEKAV